MPQPKHVTKVVDPTPVDQLDDDVKAYLETCREKLGMVPNVLTAYTSNQDKFRTFTRFYNELMLGESELSKLEREMIAVVVSSYNRCYYCLVAHGHAVRKLSGDPQLGEMLVMNYRVADLPASQRVMLDYVWKLTETPHLVNDSDRQNLKVAGWSEQAIWDINETAAFYNYTNRMAHGLDMMPNEEYHNLDR